MDALWAPWRSQYILDEKPSGCVFCVKPAEDRDADNYLLYRGQHCFVMLNAYPYNNGHLMIIPFAHLSDLVTLPDDTAAELMTLTQRSIQVLKETFHPAGFNVGMNLGAVAGAGVADHLHMHVVPRWMGDTNFMPVISDTKVIPLSLAQSYTMLAPHFA